ncbi:hypothetical protein HPCPY6271_1272 [Helicobacter pylori CPY6271]|nr:hypothetical protein HPCPY6271_1272 [Helicobacter pylori CPY6271]
MVLKIIAKKAFLQTKRAYQFTMTLKSAKNNKYNLKNLFACLFVFME